MPLRVLHIDTALDLRGGQRQLIALARGLRSRSHLQEILCPPGSRLASLAKNEGFETLPLHPHRFSAAIQVMRRLRSSPWDILHAHDGRGQTIAWLGSRGAPVGRVASRRVTFTPRGKLLHRLKYGLTCDGVIAVSEFIRQLLLESGIPEAKVEVIPDGIDFPENPPGAADRLAARARFGAAEGEFLIGHAGAFTPEKGQEVAIRAFELVERDLPQARLLLAGEGRTRPALSAKYRLSNGAGRIQLVGYLDDLSAFMASLDLFIMPSLAEGLGSSALIAMAHGVPVVASRTGGLPEILTDGEDGWLVEAGSPEKLAGAILTAAGRTAERREAGRRAREKAALFTNDIMVRKTEAFYQKVLDRKGRCGRRDP